MGNKTDKFLGRWRVTEYVFNPDGDYAGHIHQIRELHQLPNQDIRVSQHCEPSPQLKDHPMGQFDGSWVFDLKPNGRVRHYLGPDVVGTGLVWQDGVMTGSGLWPKFGYNFQSYAILVTPERQLTGGQFYLPGQNTAHIIGVAEPDNKHGKFPQLNMEARWPKRQWKGTEVRLNANGQIEKQIELTRKISSENNKTTWDETKNRQPSPSYAFTESRHHEQTRRCSYDDQHGFTSQYGPAYLTELSNSDGQQKTCFELYDDKQDIIVGLHHFYTNQRLQNVSVVHLS